MFYNFTPVHYINITFLSPLWGLPSSTVALKLSPQSFFLL
jgi:hypothetical protein